MRPRIIRVDGGRQCGELGLRLLVRGPVRVGQPRVPVADHGLPGQHPGLIAGQLRKRRHQGEPELGHQSGVPGVERADYLAAELNQSAVRQGGLLHPPADPVSRLHHQHIGAAADQVSGAGQAGQPGAPSTITS
jgi:hypothetical protein